MAGSFSIKSRLPHSKAPKRLFKDLDKLEPSSSQSGTTKRLQIDTKEPEQEAKFSSLAPRRYYTESVGSLVVESDSGSESYQERHCRLGTLLGHSGSDIIPKGNLYRADTEDGLQVSSRYSCPSDVPSDMSLVQGPAYRVNNLAENNIYLRHPHEEFPEDINRLVNHIRKNRDSPGLSSDHISQIMLLYILEEGTTEQPVGQYFKTNIFPDPKPPESLKRVDNVPIANQFVPNVGSELRVSNPVPDMLYGYDRLGAFPQQQAQLRFVGVDMANTQDLWFPFFLIEFKADGPGVFGSMWVATNQCLGGSASCVNIIEHLKHQIRQGKNTKAINNAVFSIAMNGTEARLYVSWKHDELTYYMQKVDSFLLQNPEHYLNFRKHVLNIIDWGKNERLKEIQTSLDSLLDKNRETKNTRTASQQNISANIDSSNISHRLRSKLKREKQI